MQHCDGAKGDESWWFGASLSSRRCHSFAGSPKRHLVSVPFRVVWVAWQHWYVAAPSSIALEATSMFPRAVDILQRILEVGIRFPCDARCADSSDLPNLGLLWEHWSAFGRAAAYSFLKWVFWAK